MEAKNRRHKRDLIGEMDILEKIKENGSLSSEEKMFKTQCQKELTKLLKGEEVKGRRDPMS